jgi:hypothetical protein
MHMSLKVLASVIIRVTAASIFKHITRNRIPEDVSHDKAIHVQAYYRPIGFQEVVGFGGLVVHKTQVVWYPRSRIRTRPKPSDFSTACLPSEGK